MKTLQLQITDLTNEILLHVANAHKYTLSNGETGMQTCSCPIRYKVSEEQIKQAKLLVEEKTKAIAEANKNKLFFYGRGWHKASSSGDVGNSRISVQFKNKAGRTFYLELIRGANGCIFVSHAINRDKEYLLEELKTPLLEELRNSKNIEDQLEIRKKINELDKEYYYHNYRGLEREFFKLKKEWNKENILELVNTYFYCDFTEIHVENFFYNNPFETHCES